MSDLGSRKIGPVVDVLMGKVGTCARSRFVMLVRARRFALTEVIREANRMRV
jgi:hypothetical protein